MKTSRLCLSFLAISLIVSTGVISCEKYDDSSLVQQIEDLTRRVVKLEELCSNMNTNIMSLQQMLTALQEEDRIVGVSKVTVNGEEVGYILDFSRSGAVTIYNGKDGSTPVIGVRMDTDGEWYWTVDGEWMLSPDGKHIRATATAPILSIRDGYWYISKDDGKTWEKLDKATGDSFFQSVTETDEAVVLTLVDGTVISIPKLLKISIIFDDSEDIVIMPGGQRIVNYQLTNVSGNALVKAVAQNGWRAKVEQTGNTEGRIIVTAPEILTDDEVIILAYDGEYSMVMAALNFVEGTITVSDDSFEVPGEGGSVSLEVSSNVGMKVCIPEQSASWISYKVDPATKTMVENTVTLILSRNYSGSERSAVVAITDEGGTFSKAVAIHQKEFDQYTDITGGGETANCYIVNQPGGYKFPIIKGNGPKGVIVSGDSAEINGAVSASIVWQDADIIEVTGIKNGHVTFATADPLPHGNAVIAVKDINGTILWSWHIWSTDYELGVGDVTVTNYSRTNSCQMMPLNLGARSKSSGSSDWRNGDGAVFYQFGRKDPFPSKSAVKTAAGGSLALSIANPDTFYTWNNYTDWCSDMRMDWWDAGNTSFSNYANSTAADANVNLGEKTIYDPCPPGYRVAPDDAFTGFTRTGGAVSAFSLVNGSFSYSNFAYTFNALSGSIVFKLCGGLNASAGSLLTGIGYYQSSHAAGTGIQRQLILQSTGEVDPMCAVYSRALAGAVRAVKNTYVKKEESSDYSSHGTTVQLQNHTVGNGIKVLIAGDGYMDKDIASGLYDSDMEKACEYLFSVEPFKTYRDRFDVVDYRAVSALSEFNASQKTAFKVQFGSGTHISGDLTAAYNSANSVYNTIENVLIIIVINSAKYAGTCYMSSLGTSVAFVPASQEYYTFEDIVHHEACGHGFGFLGDEYFYTGTIPSGEVEEVNYFFNTYGWYANVDVTDNPSAIRWKNFLSDPVYKSTVGIYEGAFTYAYGAYRPTNESIMRSNKGMFNSPSRYALFKRIMELSGDTSSWEKFVNYDTKNLASSNVLEADGYAAPDDFVPLSRPVIVDEKQVISSIRDFEVQASNDAGHSSGQSGDSFSRH